MRLVRSGELWIANTPAKLNLHLEVLGKRPDGFHELETLMVPIGVLDTLCFAPSRDGSIDVECRWADGWAAWAARAPEGISGRLGDLPPGDGNLAAKALRLLRERHVGPDSSLGGKLTLVKRIPSAAGLGGASSDAVAAVKLASAAWGLTLDREQLVDLAAELGSDTPFFVDPRPTLCRGRGEAMETIGPLATAWVVVARPPVGLSTPAVFKRFQLEASRKEIGPVIDAARRGDWTAWNRAATNRLTPAASRLTPWIERLEKDFTSCGAVASRMSGSGSAWFGICRDRRHATRVAARLRARDAGAIFVAQTMNGETPGGR